MAGRRIVAIAGYDSFPGRAAVGVLLRDGDMQYPYFCRSIKSSDLNVSLLIMCIAMFARPPKQGDVLHVWLPNTLRHYMLVMSGVVPYYALDKPIDRLRAYLRDVRAHAFLHEIDPNNQAHAEVVKGMKWAELASKAEVQHEPPPDAPLLDWEQVTWLSVNDPQMHVVYQTPKTRASRAAKRYFKV